MGFRIGGLGLDLDSDSDSGCGSDSSLSPGWIQCRIGLRNVRDG